jgi:phospholipid/cholesterol/gamma-HCH transport system ATP-binding protein
MNSVMTIGDKVIFIYKGQKWWEGSSKDILHADNKEVSEFVGTAKVLKQLQNK